jgi:hypothetical protein
MVTLQEYHTYIFSKQFRIAYYCGDMGHIDIITKTSELEAKIDIPFLLNYNILLDISKLVEYKILLIPGTISYRTDIINYFELIKENINRNKFVYFIIGDYISVDHPICLRKSRFVYYHSNGKIERPLQIKSCNGVLLKLNTVRHWSSVHAVHSNDIPFYTKKNKLIWRGSSTGRRPRIVEKLQHHLNQNIDIKFTRLCHSVDPKKFILTPGLSMRELLEHKFILSIEGNDIASDLKWLLYSNSVVFMCMPTKCSWAMEDLLIPFVHYVLLKDDYSDLEEKYNWAMMNLAKCDIIAQNGKTFIQHFLNEQNEMDITKEVILRYMNNVNIRIV